MRKTFMDEMFKDAEYEALFEMQKGALIELVAKRAMQTAAKRFYDQSVIVKNGIIGYDEVAEELTTMADEI